MNNKTFLVSRWILVFILILSFLNTKAQFYNTGQDRGSTVWKQINTEKFRLVYPNYAERKAQLFANKLLWASQNVGKGLDSTTAKIDVIMHMESSTSNAMVVWAPKRMEVHSLNSQNSYAQEWFEQLAIHEYRHVVQIDKLNEGFTKIISIVFGEMGTSAVLGAYLPLWYLEGDAVAVETALSNTGRGREADFNMPLRAQLMAKGKYSYDKATMGSYRNFVPDHYVLGYHLVAFGKKYYGKNIWKNAESFIARNPYYVVPLSHTIKKHSGMRKAAFYDASMDTLSHIWQIRTTTFNANRLIDSTSKLFTSYRHMQFLNDSVMFAYKTGINEIGSFVLLFEQDGVKKEKRLLLPGYSSFDNISLCDSVLFWTETRFHNRWQNVKYSVLMKYDFRTHKREQLSKKTRFISPSYNSKTSSVICVKQNNAAEYSLVLLSSLDASVIKEIAMPSFIKNPYFDESGEFVYYYILRKNGFELMELKIDDESTKSILPPSFNNRKYILKNNNSIYFLDDISGISNIYRKNLNTNEIKRITDVKYGVGNINKWGQSLIFDNYTSNGWHASSISLNSKKEFKGISYTHDLYKSYIFDSTVNIQHQLTVDSVFETVKYSKLAHAFKIHSWGPISIDVDNTNVNPGLSIMSQNLLSTTELTAGYEYKLSESASKYYAKFDYKAWPIIISLRASYEDRRRYIPLEEQHYYGYDSYTWNETSFGVYFYRGFRFNKNAFNYYIQPNAGVYYLKQRANDDTPNNVKVNLAEIISMQYGIYASVLRRTSLRDLQTRLGQTIKLSYSHTPFYGDKLGSVFALQSNTYMPFITPHSGSKTYLGFQLKKEKTFSYSDVIEMPRGLLSTADTYESSISIKQTFAIPLFYPDISITSLAYIKRVKVYLFADYLSGNQDYSSIGGDLRFDVHFLRTIAPIDIGLRVAHVSEITKNNKYMVYQFLFSVSI